MGINEDQEREFRKHLASAAEDLQAMGMPKLAREFRNAAYKGDRRAVERATNRLDRLDLDSIDTAPAPARGGNSGTQDYAVHRSGPWVAAGIVLASAAVLGTLGLTGEARASTPGRPDSQPRPAAVDINRLPQLKGGIVVEFPKQSALINSAPIRRALPRT